MKALFALRGTLAASQTIGIQVVGAAGFVLAWALVSATGMVPRGILPSPVQVLDAVPALLNDGLVWHTLASIKLNVWGYVEAVAISMPLGFALGLFPLFEALSERVLSSLRFLPLPAAMGIFIAAFGIGTNMKVQFLTVGIVVYLLPTVVQRVKETPEVYVQTAKTLGASKWRIIRSVFFPDVIGRVFDDIRVLVAVSWTYITISEVINSSQGGLGALAYTASRQGRVDKIYALLALIMLIGFAQDALFKLADKRLFPYKAR